MMTTPELEIIQVQLKSAIQNHQVKTTNGFQMQLSYFHIAKESCVLNFASSNIYLAINFIVYYLNIFEYEFIY